jgi:hypothetical protein
MRIAKKIGGVGAALAVSAATVMLGLGPAGAAAVLEVDGVQLLNGGSTIRVVADVSCPHGHTINTSVHVVQRVPGGTAHAVGSSSVTCVRGDNDVVIDATGSGFHVGEAACIFQISDSSLPRYNAAKYVEPCTIRSTAPVT